MERFDRVLRRVDLELEVREPERSRILLELAGDLSDLYREYREMGCSDGEARRRAEAWLAPDRSSVDRLRRLHTPLLGRALATLSEIGRSRIESAALAFLALASIAVAVWTIRGTSIWPPDPWVVAVLVIGGVGLAIAGRRALDLFLSPDGGLRVSKRMPGLLVLSAASALAGALGASLHLHAALASASSGAAPWQAIGRASATATLGLVVALALAIAWFWLVVRVRIVRGARADLHELVPFTFSPETGRSR